MMNPYLLMSLILIISWLSTVIGYQLGFLGAWLEAKRLTSFQALAAGVAFILYLVNIL